MVAAPPRARDASEPPPRVLYLLARSRARVGAEHDSLVVRREPAGMLRFPAARLARVVCNANADWSGAALALCCRRGIGITWVDAAGAALGACTPKLARLLPQHLALEMYAEMPDWPQRFDLWQRRRRLAVLIDHARDRAQAGRPLQTREFADCRRSYVYRNELPAPAHDPAAGWCFGVAVDAVQGAGLCARYWGHGGRALELADALSGLVLGAWQLACSGAVPQHLKAAERLLFFDTWARASAARHSAHLADLARHVAAVLAQWH